MGIVIAGDRSGVGKTTVTLALLTALTRRGLRVQSYKVGPDYIDPMFHRYVTGRACRNLDPMLTSEAYVQQCFSRHLSGIDCAIIEGVMGLFDGAGDRGDFASTAHIARLLNLPVLLVLDCSHLSGSIAAIAHGYCSFDPQIQIAGVVLNRVGSDRHLELLQAALEPLNLPIFGVLRRQQAIAIPDRHLGLIPTAELPELDALIDQLAHLGESCFDWERLLPRVQVQPRSLPQQELSRPEACLPARIAIAQDAAFSFYYADNLELLTALGAELIPWSPLSDETLPAGVQGLYFGGGFPEMFAADLATNQAARQAVRSAIQAGMPTYAECGGLMYLCQAIADFEGQPWAMVGILPAIARMGQRLTLGYRKAIARHNTPLVTSGQRLCGHEFHRSSLTLEPEDPLFEIQNQRKLARSGEGWHQPHLHASYIHLHWGNTPELPMRFLKICATQNWETMKIGIVPRNQVAPDSETV